MLNNDFYGITRSSQMFNIKNIVWELLGDSHNVSITLMNFITNTNTFEKYKFIQFPYALLSQVFNVIPSYIYPEKINLMSSHEFVVKFQATSHIFVDIVLNYGIIGSFIFFFYLGYFLIFIKL